MKGIKNIFLIQSFQSLTSSIFYILIPLLMAERKIDITTIGLVFAAAPLIFQLTRMVFAAISDIIGRKIFLVSHGVLTSITSSIFYFAHRPLDFLCGNISDGIKSGSFWSVNRAYVLDISKNPRKDLVTMRTIRYFAEAIGTLITGFLIVRFFYSGTLLLVFIIGLIGTLVALRVKNIKKSQFTIKRTFSHLDFRKRSKLFKKFTFLFIIAGLSYGFTDGYIFPLFLKNSGFAVENIGILIGIQTFIVGIFGYIYTRTANLSKLLFYGGIVYAITLPLLGLVNLFYIPMIFLLFGMGLGITDGCYEGIYTKITNKKSYASDIGLLLLGTHMARSVNQATAGFLIQNFGFGIVFILSGAIFLIYSVGASKVLNN